LQHVSAVCSAARRRGPLTCAADLFLIRPPEGAAHTAVKPEHIIVAGDSAGGGLVLAMLQVCRDGGLPLPACAVLVSPWCDMTHSFPSIHTNTNTVRPVPRAGRTLTRGPQDIIPQYGLSLYKPSTLWPPPSAELTQSVHSTLKSRIRHIARLDPQGPGPLPAVSETRFEGGVKPAADGLEHAARASDGNGAPTLPTDGQPVDVGATGPLPAAAAQHATRTAVPSGGPPAAVHLTARDGAALTIESQIQLYVPNDLLMHPLVSPALGYLGGLPPMLFLEGDKEVLRDEGIYT
jgi:acetyl esterase/lipase